VECVFSSNFFFNDPRPELFKLTDDEVSNIKVTLTDDEYGKFKNLILSGNQGNTYSVSGIQIQLHLEKKSRIYFFKDVTFSVSEPVSETSTKLSYDFEFPEKAQMLGVRKIELLPEVNDPTFLRTKLACDIRNRLGIPNQNANFANLYINDVYMGLYLMLDSIDSDWAYNLYKEDISPILYKCENKQSYLTLQSSLTNCESENDNDSSHDHWQNFLTRLESGESLEQINGIMDVDLFYIQIALEFLSGSWDHYLNNGHHYYMNRPGNKRWQMIHYDFESEFGLDITRSDHRNREYPEFDFWQWTEKRDLLDVLVFQKPQYLENMIRSIIEHTFNPEILFPRIEELKQIIEQAVIKDKTRNNNANANTAQNQNQNQNQMLPGRIRTANKEYSVGEWSINSNFISIIRMI